MLGQAQIVEGLVERFNIALGLLLLALVAFFGVEATPVDRFGSFFSVLSGWSHGQVLRLRGH